MMLGMTTAVVIQGRETKDPVTPTPTSPPPTPVDPFKVWRVNRDLTPRQERTAARAARVIQEVLATVTDDEWEEITQRVLRRIADGDGDVSVATRQFARDMLSERHADVPDEED